MKAFAYRQAHSLDSFDIRLQDVPDPVVGDEDLLIRVKAFALNPVDCKVRSTRNAEPDSQVILGWDGAGVVEALGAKVEGFAPGDAVFYAGALGTDGAYAEYQAVDHRLVARMPRSLNFAEAAALPLTALTAYEALFENGITYDEDSHVLIIGGAGGVGSMAIQLLKQLTPATVIATASRLESVEWATRMGADLVIGRDLRADMEKRSIPPLDVIFSTTHTGEYLAIIPDLLRPFGHMLVIDDPSPFDISGFKRKSLSVHWEFMFAKSLHGYRIATQGAILDRLSDMVDSGKISTTHSQILGASEREIRNAHIRLEAGTGIGKLVVQW